jgi:hypothetical protein
MFCQRQTPEMKASEKLGIWIPKSCATILSQAPDKAWHWNECRVDVKNWFVAWNAVEQRRLHVLKHHTKFDPERDAII